MQPRVILPTINDEDDVDANDVDGVVTRFDVERYACGEFDTDVARRAQIEAALAADPALKAFYDDVVASDAAFRIEAPVSRFTAKLEASSSSATPSLWARVQGWLNGGRVAALSACAAAVLVVVVARPGTDGPTKDPVVDDAGVRSKGSDARIGFFVNGSAGARPGSAGEALRAGDQIQLAVKDAADKRAMVVVGVDGKGEVSVYATEVVDTQHKGADSSARVLPASLILDDTAGAERFFVVYGDDVATTEAAARAAAERLGKDVAAGSASLVDVERLTIDDALVQSSVHIVKVR